MSLLAYVIALEKSVRFESLQQDLDLFSISFSKINAIKGSSLDEEFLESIVDLKSTHARLGHEISLPLIGCALSHKIVYKEFLRSEARWALVFEEDVRLESDIVSKVKEVQVFCETEVPRIIQLFTRGERFIKSDSIISLSGGSSMFKFASIPGQAASCSRAEQWAQRSPSCRTADSAPPGRQTNTWRQMASRASQTAHIFYSRLF